MLVKDLQKIIESLPYDAEVAHITLTDEDGNKQAFAEVNGIAAVIDTDTKGELFVELVSRGNETMRLNEEQRKNSIIDDI